MSHRTTTYSAPHQDFEQKDINSFYNQFGIRQMACFSGGFRYVQKPTKNVILHEGNEQRKDLFKQFGLARTPYESYKLNNDEVPKTKLQLADKLVDKLEHKMLKMNYYRNKYFGKNERG